MAPVINEPNQLSSNLQNIGYSIDYSQRNQIIEQCYGVKNYDYLTSFNPFEVIFDAVGCAPLAKYKGNIEDDKSLLYVGETPYGSIEMYVEKENGNIKSIKPSYTNCKIELSYE